MFPRRNPLKDVKMPQANTTSFPPETDQQPAHPHDLDEARVKRLFGFDADDPNVTVRFIPMGGGRLKDILGGAGLDNVTADGNSEAVTSGLGGRHIDFDDAAGDDGPGETSAPDIDVAKSLSGLKRLDDTRDATLDIMIEVMREVMNATIKHSPQHSPHEGHSVIREELEELWDHVKADTGRSPAARKEAIQTAAMAIRYVLDNIDAPAA